MSWTAEITNDPDRDYELYVELLENHTHRGRVEINTTGELILTIYPSKQPVSIPADWLLEIMQRFKAEAPPA